ncbi:hypothetical protein O3P69_018244 [Scylla paramamosain]|uniref:C2H2-type domain-containing protein n=1 Tax=Scylla paramamosain TaxID=85552 RepID=A0AAW0TIM2_SCYPA
MQACSPALLCRPVAHHQSGNFGSLLWDAAVAVAEDVASCLSFQCPSCGRCFSRHWHLKRHLATHLAVKPFRCPYCPHAASIKDKLKQHIRKVHPGQQVPADFEAVPSEATSPFLLPNLSDNPLVTQRHAGRTGSALPATPLPPHTHS